MNNLANHVSMMLLNSNLLSINDQTFKRYINILVVLVKAVVKDSALFCDGMHVMAYNIFTR